MNICLDPKKIFLMSPLNNRIGKLKFSYGWLNIMTGWIRIPKSN